MNKKDYGELIKKELSRVELIERIDELENENDKLRKQMDDWSDAFADCEGTERILTEEIDYLKGKVAELEDQLESKGITESRNFTIDNLYYLLCDRYGVSHHTSKDKLKSLVDEELSL